MNGIQFQLFFSNLIELIFFLLDSFSILVQFGFTKTLFKREKIIQYAYSIRLIGLILSLSFFI